MTASECGTDLDHAVTAVGYNAVANPPYYIVKNSWTADWGDAGYIMLEIVEGDGTCGIQMESVYPNKLLTDSTAVFACKLTIMLFALLGVVPVCIYLLFKRSKELPFLHPG